MNNKKKIAVFIDWFLPAYKAGGPITSVSNLVLALKDDFDFYIITSDRDLNDTKPFENIKTDIWITQNAYNIIYVSPENQNKKFYQKILKEFSFDKIYINSLFSFKFSILPLLSSKKIYHSQNIILAPRGMLSEQAFAKKNFKKKLFIITAKIFNLFKEISFQATTEKEFEDIKKNFRNNEIKAVPNLPKTNANTELSEKEKKSDELKLVSIARISQEKNTLFALKVLSQITKGKITFDLYGTIIENNYWNICKDLIASMPKNITINYKGAISSEKIEETYKNYHLSFLPSVGENFGHSIYESMSFGCPVIISDQTPWKNLEEKQIGWDIPLSNQQKFVDVINFCVKMEQKEYNIMSEKVFNFAKDYIHNNNLVEVTKNLFE